MHPGYANALQGIALPRGGPATIVDHVFGNTESEYTPWTTDWGVAETFATRESGGGVVLTITLPRSSLVISPGNSAGFGESEVLVRGTINGAQVESVP